MPEILQGRPLPEERSPVWRSGPQTARGGKLIDVELLGEINGDVALGRINHIGGTVPVTGVSTEADVGGMSVTFTARTGRYYKISWIGIMIQQAATGVVTARITDASNNSQIAVNETLGAGEYTGINLYFIAKPGNVSATYKARIGTSAGTVDVFASATAPQFIIVEDIGL